MADDIPERGEAVYRPEMNVQDLTKECSLSLVRKILQKEVGELC